MAISRVPTQITWSGANTKTISVNTEQVSDGFTVDASCTALSVGVSADNQGTAVSGDTLTVKIQWSTGDLLADGGDDYDTSKSAMYVTTLDTYAATGTLGEDPNRKSIPIPVTASKGKLAVTWNSAAPGTRNVLVSARIEEQRSA